MKILAFTDTHEDNEVFPRLKRIISEESIDLAVCAGDFTIFSRQTEEMLQKINDLGCPVALIHGNHEDGDEISGLCDGFENISFIHHNHVKMKGLDFIGHGGNGFWEYEEDIDELAELEIWNPKTVFVCHAPPYNTRLDECDPGWHVGSKSTRSLILKKRPMLVICGHIHECFHQRDTLGGATVINPGPDGEIIEVEG